MLQIFKKNLTRENKFNFSLSYHRKHKILYSPDLDRCNEDVVVKVLEAIHLILAFPLFVVVVGVDPRWLNNALSEKYKTLFGRDVVAKGNETGNSAFSFTQDAIIGKPATSYDYLEKIFQIPFALKPINKSGREKLIKYLLKDEMSNISSEPNLQLTEPSTTIISEAAGVNQESIIQKDKQLNTENKAEGANKVKEKLVFSELELDYLQKISPLFGQTPRTINRYVNIYRIIKAHGNLNMKADSTKKEFIPVMLILAIVVGQSIFAEEFIAQVVAASDTETFKEFIKSKKVDLQLNDLINSISSDFEELPMEIFKRNIDLISRFSFRTLLK